MSRGNVTSRRNLAEPAPELGRVADDAIWGAGPIGEEIGVPERRAFYLLETGQIPARKIGKYWVSSRRALRTRFACGE